MSFICKLIQNPQFEITEINNAMQLHYEKTLGK